jgi:non-ribosomal peptide synthetase component F
VATGEVLESQLNYWKQQLSGSLPILQLPTDHPRPPVQTYRGTYQSLKLPLNLTKALKALSQQEGVTLFMTLLAAFQTLLSRYSGQEDIIVGTPIAGRNQVETEGLIGLFVNTLAIRTNLSGNPSFRQLLSQVREVTLGAYDHQDLPLEKLIEELKPERDLSRSPLFQVMFVFQNTPSQPWELPGLTITPLEVHSGTSKFDLTLALEETSEGIKGGIEYNTDLFEAQPSLEWWDISKPY